MRGARADIEFLGCYVLAHPANPEKTKAKFENGSLNIRITIKRILKGKKITVLLTLRDLRVLRKGLLTIGAFR
jgi:HSP20 family molecular chaperone IbpA